MLRIFAIILTVIFVFTVIDPTMSISHTFELMGSAMEAK